ncbi:MAG: IS3 family transposase [Candidatus Jettenia caeni]|nr:IS3 family transposase [Candidatus Jettenia caeni]
MDRMNRIFTESPFYGSRSIREVLRREGMCMSKERVQPFLLKHFLKNNT